MTGGWVGYGQWYKAGQASAGGFTPKFRRTLTSLGTQVGKRSTLWCVFLLLLRA